MVLSGEGMLALWAPLSSVLSTGDVVVAVGSGVYGKGIGAMAAARGAKVCYHGCM